MFDFTPTEEQQALRTMVREFVEKEVKTKAPAYDAEPDPIKGIPWDIIEEGNALGLNKLAVREEFGGAGQSSLTLGMLVEELALEGHPDSSGFRHRRAEAEISGSPPGRPQGMLFDCH
jgi:alkylation response protein AidB-like acyl-CoA dehydrogenase